MATSRPAAAVPMLPFPPPMHISATSSRANPIPATAATSHHFGNHTQRPTPPSKFALLRSWICRTKIYLGAAIGLLTLVVTIVSLLPSFAGGRYGKETLELALWTARKDYVEACQEYLNHTSINCQQALEKGLPPPPGLDRFAARSLQRLEEEVQRLQIQPLIYNVDEHVLWLRLWLQIGTITVALILTGLWTKFMHLLRRQLTRSWYLNRALELDFTSRQRGVRGVAESALLRSHSLSQATATGINVEESQVTTLRHRTKTLASKANTVPTPESLAGGHLTARNRACQPAGKKRVEKERKRRGVEDTERTKQRSLYREGFRERNRAWARDPCAELEFEEDLTGGAVSWIRTSSLVVEACITAYVPDGTDEYEGWEIPEDDSRIAFSCYNEKGAPDVSELDDWWDTNCDLRWAEKSWRRYISSEKAAVKQAERLNSGVTHSTWPIHRSEKRNPRKRKLRKMYSHPLNRFEGLDRFEDLRPY